MNKQKGFTLVELMIAIAIIGILASIAYPSYQGHVAKSRRADAKGALTSFANAMERHFTETGQYTGAAGTNLAPVNTGAPWIFPNQSPLEGADVYYNLAIDAAAATTYTLSATPVNQQAGDKCGILTVTNTGTRDATVAGASVNLAMSCW